MKSILLSLGLVATPFTAIAQQAEDTFKVNPKLSNILSHLDTDGEALSISNDKNFLEDIVGMLDKFITALPEDKELSGVNFSRLLDSVGINGITATGESTKKDGSVFTKKFFLETQNTNSGIFSLLGLNSSEYVAHQYAPADTKFLLETRLKLTHLPALLTQITDSVDPDKARLMKSKMSEQIPPIGMSLADLLSQIDSRISVVVGVETHGQNLKRPPELMVTARIDNIAKFAWPIIQKNIAGLIEVKSDGNIHSFNIPEKMNTPLGQYTISVTFDLDQNYIWISNNKAHYLDCVSKGKKLKDNEDFKVASKELPIDGNSRLYLSKSICLETLDLVMKGLKQEAPNSSIDLLISTLEQAKAYMQKGTGIIFQMKKFPDGILLVAKTPMRMRASATTTMLVVPMLASIATPLIIQKLKEADQVKNMTNMRQLKLSIVEYEIENGHKPESLDDLIKHDPAVKGLSMMKAQGGDKPVVYVFKDQPKGKDIMMHSPSPILDQYVVMLHNGSILKLYDDEFEDMMGE